MSRHKKGKVSNQNCWSLWRLPVCLSIFASCKRHHHKQATNTPLFPIVVYLCICVLLYFYLSKTLQERLFFFQLNRNSILRWTPGRFFSLTCWRVTRLSWSFLVANLLSQGNDGSSKKRSSSKSRQQVLESDSHSGQIVHFPLHTLSQGSWWCGGEEGEHCQAEERGEHGTTS